MARQHPYEINRPHHIREARGAELAGAQLLFSADPRVWVHYISIRIRLTTDGTAANRRMILVFGGPGDVDFAIAAPMQQIATRTYDYFFGTGVPPHGLTINTVTANLALPLGARWQFPEQVRTEIENLQAGDQIMLSRFRYHAWRDPVLVA